MAPTIGYTPTTPAAAAPKDRNPKPAVKPGDRVWQFNGVWVVKPKTGTRYIVSNGRRADLPPNARIDAKNERVVLGGKDTYIRFHSGKATINRPKPQGTSDSAGATLWRALGGGSRQEADFFQQAAAPRPAPARGTALPAASAAPATGERGPAGSASPRPAAPAPAAAPAAGKGSVARALDEAMKHLGSQYVWGGKTPQTGFDCSGIVQWAYKQAGINVPAGTYDQQRQGRTIDARREDPKPGDLLFFDYSPRNGTGTGGADHVGIYLGGGKMLHAPRKGKPVQIVNVDMNRPLTIKRVAEGPQALAGLPQRNGQVYYDIGPRAVATGAQRVDPNQAAAPGQGGDPQTNPAGTGQPVPPGAPAPKPVVNADGTITAGVTPTPGALPANATDAQVKAYVRENFGDIATFLDIPEVGKILLGAARGGWSAEKMRGALAGTNWWKTTTATSREWDIAYRRDRNSAEQKVTETAAGITQQAAQIGVTITPQRARDLAVKVNRLGWTAQQVTQTLSNTVTVTGNTPMKPGEGATTVATLKQQARSFLVPISDATLTDWTRKIIAGTVRQQDFDAYLREQAKSLFPGMAGAIESGVTPEQYVQPYQQLAAQLLEVAPESVDFLNPKYGKALFQVDPKTGNRSAMSLADWQDYLRSTPDYNKTKQFREQAASFGQGLIETWGLV